MRFFYLTMKVYPASTADHVYVRELCRALSRLTETTLVVRSAGEDVSGMRLIEVPVTIPSRTLSFAWWFIRFVRRDPSQCRDAIFFTSDFNLAVVVVLTRILFRFSYTICTEWHLMTGTWRDTLVARGSDAIATTSKTLRGAVIHRFPSTARKISVIYGGIDPIAFNAAASRDPMQLRNELGLPLHKKLFGYTGYFQVLGMKKGIGTMIKTLAILPPEFALVCVGARNSEKKEYEELAEELHVADRCFIREAEPHGRIPLYLRAVDVAVIPYGNAPHFKRYGFPMKVWEYLASGAPIVYAKLPVIDEVLAGRGIAFTPEDSSSLAEAVRTAAALPRKTREDTYSWEYKAKRLLEVCTQTAL